MKISLSWLRDYLKTTQTAQQLAETLTRSGIEVKSIETHGAAIPKVVVAQILESTQHPNADRLSVCKVDDGSGTFRQIVCGAKNYKVGDKVFLALPGAVLPGDLKIKVGKLRGVESEGMMCSAKELKIGEGVEGLHILPPETIIGTALEKIFPADEVLELEVTPNRPDWLGYVGVAREAAVFDAGEFIEPFVNLPSNNEDKSIAIITATSACSFYSIRRIDNIKMKPSPGWLVHRLGVMGARPINLVVDLANYVMFEIGQPLHAFDAAKIQGALNVRFAHEGETLEALDGKTYQLRSADLVIADDQGPQALAGIIGGMKSGVTAATTSILLESATFDAATVAASIRFHGIHTEAGYRFERGNRAGTLEASARVAGLFGEFAAGVGSEKLFVAGQLPEPIQIELRGDQVSQLLGANISDDQIEIYLKKLGLLKKENRWLIPSWRSDLHRSVDLIEEVVRVHGIEAIKARCVSFSAPSSEADRNYDFMMQLRRRLAAAGFFEARTSTLVAKGMAETMELRNPMGEQQAFLRAGLLTGLKKALQHNLHQGAASVRLFELGKVFQQTEKTIQSDGKGEGDEEIFSLGMIAAGATTPISWRNCEQRLLDLYDLKSAIDQLAPGKISYQSWQGELLEGFALMLLVFVGGEECGYLGLLTPAAARELMLTGQQFPVALAELRIDFLQKAVRQNAWGEGKVLSKFPGITRDLALIVDKSISYAALEEVLLSAKEELLQSVAPFDVFVDPSGEKIAANKKSVALSLKFQHEARTLTAEEVHGACERLIALLEKSLQVEVRK